MDARGKKALINRTFEKLRRGVCSELYPVYSDNVVVHAPPPLGIQAGPEGVRKCIKVIRRTLETMEPLERGVMVDMNKVAVHWSLEPRVCLPAVNGERRPGLVPMEGAIISRLERGRFAEIWCFMDGGDAFLRKRCVPG